LCCAAIRHEDGIDKGIIRVDHPERVIGDVRDVNPAVTAAADRTGIAVEHSRLVPAVNTLLIGELPVIIFSDMKGIVSIADIMAEIRRQEHRFIPLTVLQGLGQGVCRGDDRPGQDPLIHEEIAAVQGRERIEILHDPARSQKLREGIDIDVVFVLLAGIAAFAAIGIRAVFGQPVRPGAEKRHLRREGERCAAVDDPMSGAAPAVSQGRTGKDQEVQNFPLFGHDFSFHCPGQYTEEFPEFQSAFSAPLERSSRTLKYMVIKKNPLEVKKPPCSGWLDL